jgi:hypothetical protein
MNVAQSSSDSFSRVRTQGAAGYQVSESAAPSPLENFFRRLSNVEEGLLGVTLA